MMILASSSPYRRELLARLGLPLQCFSPNIDEAPLPQEPCSNMVERLAKAKAQAVATQFQTEVEKTESALIIGSDQAAVLHHQHQHLGKPGNHENAVQQLQSCSGNWLSFFTGVAVFKPLTGEMKFAINETRVLFRQLTLEQIDSYLRREQPYDCAGSFKVEGLGIALFEKVESDDPTALIGLPLIALTSLLSDFGIDLLRNDG